MIEIAIAITSLALLALLLLVVTALERKQRHALRGQEPDAHHRRPIVRFR